MSRLNVKEKLVAEALGYALAAQELSLFNGGYTGVMELSAAGYDRCCRDNEIDTNTLWGIGFPDVMVGFSMNPYGNRLRTDDIRERDYLLSKCVDVVISHAGGGGTSRELYSALSTRWPYKGRSGLPYHWPSEEDNEITLDDLASRDSDQPRMDEIDDRDIIVYGMENAATVVQYLESAYKDETLDERLFYIPDAGEDQTEKYTYMFHRGIFNELLRCIRKSREGYRLQEHEEEFLADYRFMKQFRENPGYRSELVSYMQNRTKDVLESMGDDYGE